MPLLQLQKELRHCPLGVSVQTLDKGANVTSPLRARLASVTTEASAFTLYKGVIIMIEHMDLEFGCSRALKCKHETIVTPLVVGRTEAHYIRIISPRGWYWLRLSEDGSLVIEAHEPTTFLKLQGIASYEHPFHYLCAQPTEEAESGTKIKE